MEKIKQLIERQREQRLAIYENWKKEPGETNFADIEILNERYKSFHSQSTKDLIDAVVEEVKTNGLHGDFDSRFVKHSEFGYEQAKQDTITQLLAIKEML